MNPQDFKDREIYLTITTDERSDSAEEALNQIKKGEPFLSKVLDAYEDWPDLPTDAYLIDLYFEIDKEKPRYLSISKSPSVNDPLGKIKPKEKLFLCYKEKYILGFKLNENDKKKLIGKVKELWEAPIGKGDGYAKFIKLEDALYIINS